MTQDNKAENFSFVPDLPMNRSWTDKDLYKKYKLTQDEIAFIEKMIRPMKESDE
jgi:site-specific DNA-methyltransferase (adenine-specific)